MCHLGDITSNYLLGLCGSHSFLALTEIEKSCSLRSELSCINNVRSSSWLSNFQLNNLHNICVSREETEQFAKYFSFKIIINSTMISFSLNCEMVLVNINIYTQSVSNLSVQGHDVTPTLTCQVWVVQSEHLFFYQQQHGLMTFGCCQKQDCTEYPLIN